MPNDLSNLELDEVSLVGKAATGKKFLIFKNTKGVKKMKTKPAGATKAGAGASVGVSKADIMEIVKSAVAPLQKENAELRDAIRKKELVAIAKSDFAEILPDAQEGAELLKSLEGLPSEARKPIIKALKQANALKAEASKMLFSQIGSSRPVAKAGTAAAGFMELVEKYLGEVRKSADGTMDEKSIRARAYTLATKENPALAKAYIAESRGAV